jgi:hypothetical protein
MGSLKLIKVEDIEGKLKEKPEIKRKVFRCTETLNDRGKKKQITSI